jgi:hypothetical protein
VSTKLHHLINFETISRWHNGMVLLGYLQVMGKANKANASYNKDWFLSNRKSSKMRWVALIKREEFKEQYPHV